MSFGFTCEDWDVAVVGDIQKEFFFLYGKKYISNMRKGEICLKLRNLKNLPVFNKDTAQVVGRVEKAVIGDDGMIAYIVVDMPGQDPKMILGQDFSLGKESVIVENSESIKSYAHGEELSIYKKKLGDVIFNSEGEELGVVTDLILSPDNKEVQGFEVSSGGITDFLEGRKEIAVDQVCWKNASSGVIPEEGE